MVGLISSVSFAQRVFYEDLTDGTLDTPGTDGGYTDDGYAGWSVGPQFITLNAGRGATNAVGTYVAGGLHTGYGWADPTPTMFDAKNNVLFIRETLV